jgi:hypothetical protein
VDIAIFYIHAAVLYAAFFAFEGFEIGFVFVPCPPFRVCEVADVGEGGDAIRIIYCNYSAACFFCLVDLRLGEAGASTDADNGATAPDWLNDAESVEGPAGAAAENFFSRGSCGLVSLGPIAGWAGTSAFINSQAPASISRRAREGVAQKMVPPVPSAMMHLRLTRSCAVLNSDIKNLSKKTPANRGNVLLTTQV